MKTVLKCLAIDDEPVALEILEDYIAKVPFLECEGVFRDPLKALDYLRKNRVDLIFLDINMPDLTGIQFLKTLKKQPLVIFTTAYSEYALESYDYDAVDYLLKPIEFERFVKASNKACEILEVKVKDLPIFTGERDHIFIKSGTNFHKVKTKNIFYIKGTGNYVTFVLDQKEILSLLTMTKALEALPQDFFFRIHKSYIVNSLHVDLIENEEVRIGGERIPIGDSYRQGFFESIKKYTP
jgi:two-component system LytT family response regulator